MLIKNCFDSHLHWQGIGSFHSRLNLKNVTSLGELQSLKYGEDQMRGHWLLGHGLSNSFFKENNLNPINTLSDIWPSTPIYFTSPDIHSVFLNKCALQDIGLIKNLPIQLDPFVVKNKSEMTGQFKDLAKDFIDKKLPKFTDQQVRSHLKIAQDIIVKAGVTHIRDLTCSVQQFKQAKELQKNNELKLVADLFFKLNTFENLKEHVESVLRLREMETSYLKVKGIKVFIDGALGSEGALLSSPYLSGKNGFKLFSDIEIKKIINCCFENKLEVAFHTIGDQASKDVLYALNAADQQGTCHLEHVQLLDDESIELIKKHKVICHMQPQHWLSDKDWLSSKIGLNLINKQFRWADLERNNISFYFGSDAPVENMNIGQVLNSINISKENQIPPLVGAIDKRISYPGESPLCTETLIDEQFNVVSVNYNNI